jgi:hypothetical protein
VSDIEAEVPCSATWDGLKLVPQNISLVHSHGVHSSFNATAKQSVAYLAESVTS